MSLTPDLELEIRRCVDDVLETLGKNGKRAFFSFLERKLGLEEEEIPQKPELFSKGLNLVFGERGGDILETTIVKKLMTYLGIDTESKLTLVGAIVIIKATQEKPVKSAAPASGTGASKTAHKRAFRQKRQAQILRCPRFKRRMGDGSEFPFFFPLP